MRRHVSWIVLLVLAPVTYLVMAALVAWLGPSVAEDGSVPLSLLMLLAVFLAFGGPIVFLVLAIVQMRRVYRRARRRAGKYTASEREQLASQHSAGQAWEHARSIRRSLIAREIPASMQQWEVVPLPGERFFARLTLGYSRYYGQDVAYSTGGGFYFGRPAFVIGALAASAIANSVARSSAQAQAAPQWREWQTAIVYVTNHRLVVHANGAWLTFSYTAMTAVYPEVAGLTLVCQFDGAEPMLLTGADAPIAAVYTVLQTYGPDALAAHPSLQPLDVEAPKPSLGPIGREKPTTS